MAFESENMEEIKPPELSDKWVDKNDIFDFYDPYLPFRKEVIDGSNDSIWDYERAGHRLE